MRYFLKNEKGLTLVEVTAVLVLSVIILGFLIYLLNYSNMSLNQVSAREKTLQQQRDIMSQVVKTVRKGYSPAPLESKSSNLRLVSSDNDEAVDYTYDSSSKTLHVSYKPIVENVVSATPTSSFTFSDHVENILFDAKDGRIEITLEMKLPNDSIKKTSTVVYTTQRIS
ncbi:type II secretion system protein J [Bacillus sp. FJAT-28004]|uniref:PulJ/GspJ family protein n=1 Tax=Bacillus sp. FJAT-28004 TaxID=1679165 RepID=UPI0006B5D274|nr:hypothetical protein [Bacillus sp. FJAT-28004]